jgi:putative methionine-R-sulfoxide reductase with GAF domain
MGKPVLNRVYAPVLAKAKPVGGRDVRMKHAIDLLWDHFSMPIHPPDDSPDAEQHPSISWVGFYTKVEGSDEMVLGVCRNKPACSPIGLHGVCGRCWKERAPVLVADVVTLGKDYIACDPLDKSELCVPLLNDDGTCWGVLDADSYQAEAFDERDVKGMTMLLQRLGLTSKAAAECAILRV